MRKLMILAAAMLASCAAAPALAQQSYPTAAAGVRVPGTVPLQCDANGANCAPANAANPAAMQGNVASGSADSGNPVKIGGVAASTPNAGLSAGQRGNVLISTGGAVWTALGARTTASDGVNNTLGQTMSDGVNTSNYAMAWDFVFNGTTWDRQKKPNSVSRLLSAAATTNSTLVKASAGDLFQIDGQNVKAAAIFVKLYNKASAPTCGTDVPVATFYVAASSHYNFRFDTPMYFSTGIGLCLTAAAADADTTALVAGDVVAQNVFYQ